MGAVPIASLGADGPYDFVNYNAHYGWALNAIQNGHPEWLVSEMNMRIDREHFLPDHDDWCYAYGSDAPNERKYGRVSILQARLATQNGMSWDSPGQGTLDGNAHVTWARFQPVEVMRQELKGKFLQMMTKLADPGARADAYANITDTVVTLGADGPYDFVNYNAHYGWALNASRGGRAL